MRGLRRCPPQGHAPHGVGGGGTRVVLVSTLHIPGLTLTDLTLTVPLDAAEPSGRTIDVFARVVTGEGGENKPYLVFLQGGPGNEAPRPSLQPSSPPWLERALEEYQVVMLDQRGTGRSTPVGTRWERETGCAVVGGELAGLSGEDQAEYLTHLRADEIVNDCEAVREALGAEKWTVLGQSFGGFTSLHYLSAHPESLAGAIITGGLPAVGRPADDVYAATWEIMARKSERYYRAFPGDRERMRELMHLADAGELLLPNGDAVSAARLRTVGQRLGMQGGPEQLHYLLELDHRSPAFSHDLQAALPFTGRTPIYSVLHESSYADGVVTDWSAERTMPDRVAEDPTLLGGEHMHRSLFTEDSALAPFREAADLLAAHQWNRLYEPEALAQADVPVAAVIYDDDAYVPREFSLQTAALLPDARTWVTSEYEHNGLRMGSHVIDHLLGLLHSRRWL